MSRSLKKGPFADASLLKKIDMVGHKLGEFVPTRTYRGHAGSVPERKGGVR